MKFVYLASYPKSGNTFLRFLLHAAFFGPAANSAEISKRVPDIQRNEQQKAVPFDIGSELVGGEMLFAKTHLLPGPWIPGWTEAAGVISIIRDPRDILRSGLHYRKMATDNGKWEVPDSRYASIFIEQGGDPIWSQMGYGTIPQHTVAWQTTHLPLLTIRYEDLKEDPAAKLIEICEFLRLKKPLEQSALDRAVELASFENMRAMEVREKQNTTSESPAFGDPKSLRNGMYFVNKALSHQRLADFGPGFDRAFDSRFGPYLDAYGYPILSSSRSAS